MVKVKSESNNCNGEKLNFSSLYIYVYIYGLFEIADRNVSYSREH